MSNVVDLNGTSVGEAQGTPKFKMNISMKSDIEIELTGLIGYAAQGGFVVAMYDDGTIHYNADEISSFTFSKE